MSDANCHSNRPNRHLPFPQLLPTTLQILADPVALLPKLLHTTRTGGVRPLCRCARLAAQIASGSVMVASLEISLQPNSPLPRRTGSESDDHRRLRDAAARILRNVDSEAVIAQEVMVDCGPLKRRFDCFAATTFGAVAVFAGAVDGRDPAEFLEKGRIHHCMLLPFRGLRLDHARGFVFSRSDARPFPCPLH